MNLAIKDIRYHKGRFLMTCIGVGLLLSLVMAMSGMYRGLLDDATVVMRSVGADIWVVQQDTRGPFAETSRIPEDIHYSISIVPGVAEAAPFIFYNMQRVHEGRKLRFLLIGYDVNTGFGGPARIISGGPIAQKNYEMVADKKLGLKIGEQMKLGIHHYTVVGLTEGMVSFSGDPAAYVSLSDAQEIQFRKDNDAIRNERERIRSALRGVPAIRPDRVPVLTPEVSRIARNEHIINAVVARIEAGTDARAICDRVKSWNYFSAYTAEEQKQFLTSGICKKARRQLWVFRVVLMIVSAVVIALIIYTMTLEKMREIAILKLIGTPDLKVIGMILQQALAIGTIGFAVAGFLGYHAFHRFPRRVIVVQFDLCVLFAITMIVCVLASMIGIWQALKVRPAEALLR